MKTLTPLVAFCVAGVVLCFAGSLYTGYQIHQEKNKPQPSVFPTPAGVAAEKGASIAPAPDRVTPGGLPTPAR